MNQNLPINIAQLIPSLQSGGVERGVVDIANETKERGFKPIVISSGGVLVNRLTRLKIEHIKLNVASKNPLIIILNIKKLVDLIQKYQIRILHVRSRAPMWSAYFACKITKTTLISTVHGTYSLKGFGFKRFFLKKIYNSIMLKSDSIIAVSNFIGNYIFENYTKENHKFFDQKILREKTAVIARGADIKYFNSDNVTKGQILQFYKKWHIDESKQIILMPARFTSWKGHEFLINSLSLVKEDYLCLMVGSSHGHEDFVKRIEKLITQKGLESKIRNLGLCQDMVLAYAISNIVVCPSIRPEAFGRIPIEAGSSKRIIIATNIGGALETVIDGKTGFLVEPNNYEQLADRISKCLNLSNKEIKEMTDAGRKNVEENFSNYKMCKSVIDLYQKFIDNDN